MKSQGEAGDSIHSINRRRKSSNPFPFSMAMNFSKTKDHRNIASPSSHPIPFRPNRRPIKEAKTLQGLARVEKPASKAKRMSEMG